MRDSGWIATERFNPTTGAEAAIWGSDGDMVAEVHGNLAYEITAIDRANLIAAAPDLLAALEIAWRWQNSDLEDEDEVLNIMALAIAKATGKEA